jgi:ABC-type glycerol-3-phosphate transport system substrate-binding protein
MKYARLLFIFFLVAVLSTTAFDLLAQEGDPQVTITMWQHSYPPLNDWTQRQIADFEAAHPTIDVQYELVPFEEWNQRILTALATGQGPNFFEADDYTFAQFVANNQIAAIDPTVFGFETVEEMTAAWEPNSMNLVTFDGQIYGIPYDWEAPVVGYNLQLFEEAGVDPADITSWEDLQEVASQLAERDANGTLTTSGMSFVHNIDVYYQLQGATLLRQAGAQVLNDEGTAAAINSPEAQRVFELWRDMIHAAQADAPGFTATFYTNEFCEGRVAMGFMLTWANSILAPCGYTQGEDFGLMKLPTFEGGADEYVSYSWNWVANATNTPDQNRAVFMLMDYLSQQGATYLAEAGLINPRIGWREEADEELLALYDPIFNALAISEPITPHVKFNEVWAPVMDVFRAVEVDPNADIPALLAEAEQEINAILAR